MIKNKKASGRRWEEGKGILRAHYCFPSSNALRLKEESANAKRGFSLDKKRQIFKDKVIHSLAGCERNIGNKPSMTLTRRNMIFAEMAQQLNSSVAIVYT